MEDEEKEGRTPLYTKLHSGKELIYIKYNTNYKK